LLGSNGFIPDQSATISSMKRSAVPAAWRVSSADSSEPGSVSKLCATKKGAALDVENRQQGFLVLLLSDVHNFTGCVGMPFVTAWVVALFTAESRWSGRGAVL
jgi:hypothetical protein